jgi:hypothetical protein
MGDFSYSFNDNDTSIKGTKEITCFRNDGNDIAHFLKNDVRLKPVKKTKKELCFNNSDIADKAFTYFSTALFIFTVKYLLPASMIMLSIALTIWILTQLNVIHM